MENAPAYSAQVRGTFYIVGPSFVAGEREKLSRPSNADFYEAGSSSRTHSDFELIQAGFVTWGEGVGVQKTSCVLRNIGNDIICKFCKLV